MRQFTLEHRKKLSDAQKRNPQKYWLGKKRSHEDREKFRLSHIGKKQTAESKLKKSLALQGEKSPHWKGGIDGKYRKKNAPYPAPNNCEICGRESHTLKKGLCLDHDHKTNKFRGWLCSPCNVALGMVQDKPERLALLIKYLEKHASDTCEL